MGRGRGRGWEKREREKVHYLLSPNPLPPFFPFVPVPYPFLPLPVLGIDIIHDPQFDSAVGNKLSLYSYLRKGSQIWIYLDLIKNVKTRVAVTKMQISCHLLPIESGATRRYPELRGFAPFVIDSKLVMNSTICWNVFSHHFRIQGVSSQRAYTR